MVGSVCEELAWLWDGVGGGCSTIEAWEQWQKVGDAAEYLIKVGNTQLTAPLCPRPHNHCQCPTMQIEIMLHQGKWNFQRKKNTILPMWAGIASVFFANSNFRLVRVSFVILAMFVPDLAKFLQYFPFRRFLLWENGGRGGSNLTFQAPLDLNDGVEADCELYIDSNIFRK